MNYDSELFQVNTIVSGNLFAETFPNEMFVVFLEGEVSIAFGASDLRASGNMFTGTACIITLTAISPGASSIYISSLDMIKVDGLEIDECCPPFVEALEVIVLPD